MGLQDMTDRTETRHDLKLLGGYVVGYRGGTHRVIENGAIAVTRGKVSYLGPAIGSPPAATVYDYGKALITPGFISTHAHIGSAAGDRMIVDGGRRDLQRTGFLNYQPAVRGSDKAFSDGDNRSASIRYGMSCLLRNGCTTVVEMGGGAPDDGMEMPRAAEECGIRLFYAPVFNEGRYYFERDGRISCERDRDLGRRGLERAVAFVEAARREGFSRYQGILVADEAINCSVELLRDTQAAARDLGIQWTVHIAEQVYEFHSTLRATGHTPVGVFADAGLLDPSVILGHCRYIGGNSAVSYPFADDMTVLAESGAHVAHAPVAGARRGSVLESFQRYRDAGINLSIGTDTYPLDIVMEMTYAAILSKVADGHPLSATAGDVFNAATLGGANAIARADLGRLDVGAPADIVIFDFSKLRVGPVFDPIRSLVYSGSGDLVQDVYVDGNRVVRSGNILGWNATELLNRTEAGARAAWKGFRHTHWTGRPAAEIYPASFPSW